jgi:D-amino-acid dehydrogenase
MYGLRYAYLDRAELRRREPFVSEVLIGGIHWLDSATVSDPGGIVKGLAELFVGRGGVVLKADANGLRPEPCGWGLAGGSAGLKAREAVVALGPWSDAVYGRLGYRLPLAVKRGYHMHYRLPHDFTPARPIYDADGGFLLAPMRRGIRLTTGIEFAARDAPPSPVQLARAEPLAREVFPLGARVDPTAWMGARPCLPDMRPVIGPAPAHRGLWFAFGHNHHGFTLGPVTGRLLAEMMTGEKPFADPAPYSPARFDR